jgi:hypothetical protein
MNRYKIKNCGTGIKTHIRNHSKQIFIINQQMRGTFENNMVLTKIACCYLPDNLNDRGV